MKAPAFLISGILSGKFVASGQQQKVRGAFADHDHDKHNSVPQYTIMSSICGLRAAMSNIKTKTEI